MSDQSQGQPEATDGQIAETLSISRRTVIRIKQRQQMSKPLVSRFSGRGYNASGTPLRLKAHGFTPQAGILV